MWNWLEIQLQLLHLCCNAKQNFSRLKSEKNHFWQLFHPLLFAILIVAQRLNEIKCR